MVAARKLSQSSSQQLAAGPAAELCLHRTHPRSRSVSKLFLNCPKPTGFCSISGLLSKRFTHWYTRWERVSLLKQVLFSSHFYCTHSQSRNERRQTAACCCWLLQELLLPSRGAVLALLLRPEPSASSCCAHQSVPAAVLPVGVRCM